MDANAAQILFSSPTYRFTKQELKNLLNPQDLKVLEHTKILYMDGVKQDVFCQECSQPHDVKIDLPIETPHFICPNIGSVVECEPDEYECQKFDVVKFFSVFSTAAKLSEQPVFLNEQSGALFLGSYRKNGGLYLVYFTQQEVESITASVEAKNGNAFAVIITIDASKVTIPMEYSSRFRTLELSQYFDFSRKKIKWDTDAWETDTDDLFRVVRGTNGKLIVNGKVLREYTANQAQYHFLHFLDQHFDQAQSQDVVFAYCQKQMEQLGHTFTYDKDTFCTTMRSKIANQDKESKADVEKVLTTIKIKNAKAKYKLTNPSQS